MADARTRWMGSALALGVAVTLALMVVAAELWILPALTGLPREVYLMGFAARAEEVPEEPVNPMGFTGVVPTRERPDGTVRVLTLGGSVLFNRRVTERLQDRLERSASGRVEVVGAALRSHTTWSSVLKYGLLAEHGFDYVLICHGINDLYANHVAREDFRDDYSHLEPWYRRGWLLDRSIVARVLYNELVWRRPGRVQNGAGMASADVFSRNLTGLVREVRSDGGTPILVSFPWWIPPDYTHERFMNGELAYNNPERYDYCPVKLWGQVRYVRRGLAQHNLAIRAVARTEKVPLIDAERALRDDPALFGDVCHPSEMGTEILVDLIGDFFERRGRLDPDPASRGAAPGKL